MGNQMSAELETKFKALQIQADSEANKKLKNRNGIVDADNKKEILIFQNLVTKQYTFVNNQVQELVSFQHHME